MVKLDKKKTILMGIVLVVAVLAIYVYLNFFRTFTVTFNVRIGAGIASEEVRIGEVVDRPSDPTAEGYTFLWWLVDGEEYDFSTPVESNLTLTAEWEENN